MGSAVSREQRQIIDWVNYRNWGLSLAVTLNLKQSRIVYDDRGRSFYIPLTDEQINKTVRHFINLINRSMYGNNWRRFNQRIDVFSVREKSNRHHLHLRIKIPSPTPTSLSDLKQQSQITQKLMKSIRYCWKGMDWGYGLNRLSLSDNGWTEYQMKKRSKFNLTDSIICDGTYLPSETSQNSVSFV